MALIQQVESPVVNRAAVGSSPTGHPNFITLETTMIEAMLFSRIKFSGQAWDGVYPPQDENTLFRMHTFSSPADIIDKGPNSLAVSNNNVTVGSDSLGSFMKFNGSNAYLSFANALLTSTSMDITIIIGDIVYPTTAPYYFTLLDGRPTSTNGRYASFAAIQTPPFKPVTVYGGLEYISTKTVATVEFPAVITYQIRNGSFTTIVNGVEIQKVSVSNPLNTPQNWIFGKSAFSSVGGVPWLNAKVYYIDFKKSYRKIGRSGTHPDLNPGPLWLPHGDSSTLLSSAK